MVQDLYLRTPLANEGYVKVLWAAFWDTIGWLKGLKIKANKVWWFRNAFLLLHSLTEMNGATKKFLTYWGRRRYELKKKFKENFGGLKNVFYLCTPLRKRRNGKLTKSSLDNKTDVRYRPLSGSSPLTLQRVSYVGNELLCSLKILGR